jgi:hypothetical protein
MPLWLLWLLLSFEAGFWSALAAGKLRDRGKVRELLLHGQRASKALPLIDEKLRKAAGTPTKSQAFAARHITSLIRWLVNTRAMELAILIGLKRNWPKGNAINSHVKLSL